MRKETIILETKRLYLRKLTNDDFKRLYEFMSKPTTMYAYEHGFSKQETKDWLNRQINRYETDGFGLWAVILKEDNTLVGQCGITIQDYQGKVMEIGYVFDEDYWKHGYAIEAAQACKEYGFETLHADALYSIIRDTNTASIQVALRNGMKQIDTIIKHYYDIDMPHYIYRITKEDYKRAK